MNDAMEAVAAKAAARTAKSRERRQARIAKNTATSWRIVWEDSLRKFYPECRITYSNLDAANLNRMVRSRGLPSDDLCGFFAWVVEHWARLRMHVFSNYPGKAWGPEQPDMKFLLAHIARVHAEYERSKPEVASTLPLAHRTGRTPAALASPPAPAKPAPLPSPRLAVKKPSASIPRAPTFDARKAEAARVKLGLKKWDE